MPAFGGDRTTLSYEMDTFVIGSNSALRRARSQDHEGKIGLAVVVFRAANCGFSEIRRAPEPPQWEAAVGRSTSRSPPCGRGRIGEEDTPEPDGFVDDSRMGRR